MSNGEAFKTDQDGDYVELRVGEVLDYSHEWADFLAASGNDTIANNGNSWSAPAGVTVSSPTIAGSKTYAFFAVSAAGVYVVDNLMTTNGGRTKKESFRIIGKP